ncbi:hypothetical protein PV10_05297 [Exophiala mesophila]|uniref:Cytochrome P450 n=1 Tax=Exophiala mesophila TaxID=212818 RepID=A0A0D1WNP9_EXOME|nr:uncharacterized protein PV10_05297 [Exophiala mesophila]KIV90665.1 hypothetical protein PV10_05297 [Exophiala mesophila]
MWGLTVLLLGWFLVVVVEGCVALRTKVPGPWYNNFTSMVLKYHEFSKNRRLWIHHLHRRYGPVVRLSPNEVSFANLDGMKEIYQSGGSGYDKTEFYDLFKQYNNRTMFSTLNRHDHARRKKLFAEKYAMTNVVNSDIIQGIEQRAASVVAKCTESLGGHLDVYVTLHCYALDCASHFLFNPGGTDSLNNPNDLRLMQELSYHDSIRQRWIQHYWPILDRVNTIFRPKAIPLSSNYVLGQAQNTKGQSSSLLYKLQSKSSGLPAIKIAAECMDHMAAGIDTTGDALCFLMHELSLPRCQHIQKHLHQEIVDNPDVKTNDLVYLDAVVKEGLRLFPPIPMSLPRYVPREGHNISGYDIPGGSIVSCQAYTLHLLNPDVFPEGDRFLPERWLEKEGEAERNRLFFAFASGGRGCIGKSLALMEMKTLLREVYGRFITKVSPQMKGDMSIDDQIIASRPKDQTCLLEFERLAEIVEPV